MNLSCIGISHHTAPLESRERVWFSPEEIRSALPLLQEQGIQEAVLFSTCNRTELYTFFDGSVDQAPLIDFIRNQKSAPDVPISQFFTLHGREAVDHLLRVATGIDSLVIGDAQILSQVKEGLNLARDAGTAGFLLTKLFQAAFHTAKRARAKTRIGEGAVSVSYAAVELAERIFDDFSRRSALVIGAGEMAQLTAKYLKGRNIGNLFITNRTEQRSEQLAAMVGGTVLPFNVFSDTLDSMDIIISSVSVDQYILTADDIKKINKQRHATALFIIDIGVPRSIDPSVKKLENVFLYDLDSLNGLVNENEQKRRDEVPKVETIVSKELVAFEEWFSSLEATPTIAALKELVEEIRREEVEKNINRFDPKDRELVEILTKRIANKILHTPIVNLKNGKDESHSEQLRKISSLRRLFGIDEKRDSVNGR
ncbi:MAG: glutamyl-tRNA reductase [Ignavibacteriales bacterium]|nr:glutamyl-tRNA reductase [Ignavibacteriales bacterium]